VIPRRNNSVLNLYPIPDGAAGHADLFARTDTAAGEDSRARVFSCDMAENNAARLTPEPE